MDIVTLAAARKGSGGGASKEYVDEKVAALINDTTAAQNKTYSSARVEEKVAGEEITTTATGSDLTLSTSSGNLNALTVYGKSEVVDDAIVSAGEGWATVDLGTLNWNIYNGAFFANITDMLAGTTYNAKRAMFCKKYTKPTITPPSWAELPNKNMLKNDTQAIFIKDTDYETPAQFKTAMLGVILAYQLADPTQGNAIAVKTDNGTGIDGTMATFTTGTPLRGIPDTDVRDVMQWNGSSGAVTKNCGKVRLADLTWNKDDSRQAFHTNDLTHIIKPAINFNSVPNLFIDGYTVVTPNQSFSPTGDMRISVYNYSQNNTLVLRNLAYATVSDFVASLSDEELIFEFATPTPIPLTSTENASIAGLRTFEPQTHAKNNAGADMTVEAYAGTANGKAVNELKQDVQSEISALKITQSGTLTLTAAGWSNNAQTVTYAHDTAKRNVIDVEPSSIEEWASCGILATAETASGITFTCKTVPENALNFKVTSMGV